MDANIISAMELTGYVILGLLVYRFILNSLSLGLGFIAKRTVNKVDDDVVSLLNKLARASKTTVDLMR